MILENKLNITDPAELVRQLHIKKYKSQKQRRILCLVLILIKEQCI